MLSLSEPRVVHREPAAVVGAYCAYEGEDEMPGWSGAHRAFSERRGEVTNRVSDAFLGFLYRPHRDYAEIEPSVRSCFIGVEVADLSHVPDGLAATQFSGGTYVMMSCTGDTQGEAAMGVGDAVGMLEAWLAEHGYAEGDACFASSDESAATPPYVEYVYIRAVETS